MIGFNGNGLGLFTGCIIPDAKSAAAIAPLVLLPLQLFSG